MPAAAGAFFGDELFHMPVKNAVSTMRALTFRPSRPQPPIWEKRLSAQDRAAIVDAQLCEERASNPLRSLFPVGSLLVAQTGALTLFCDRPAESVLTAAGFFAAISTLMVGMAHIHQARRAARKREERQEKDAIRWNSTLDARNIIQVLQPVPYAWGGGTGITGYDPSGLTAKITATKRSFWRRMADRSRRR